MISLIREKVLLHGWLTEAELLNMIAVAESTPGPIAVNMATLVGSEQGGILGSLFATLGVVLPSFLIILLIASIMRNLLKYAGVKAFLGGIRPCVVGLILATAITMFMSTVIGFANYNDTISVDITGILIFAILLAIGLIAKLAFKSKPSPILMILISAGLGIVMHYSVVELIFVTKLFVIGIYGLSNLNSDIFS